MRRWTDEEDEFISKNLSHSRKWIAEQLGRTVPSVANRINMGLYIHTEKQETVYRESDTPERREMFIKMMCLIKVKSRKINEPANIDWFKFRQAFGQFEQAMGGTISE